MSEEKEIDEAELYSEIITLVDNSTQNLVIMREQQKVMIEKIIRLGRRIDELERLVMRTN